MHVLEELPTEAAALMRQGILFSFLRYVSKDRILTLTESSVTKTKHLIITVLDTHAMLLVFAFGVLDQT